MRYRGLRSDNSHACRFEASPKMTTNALTFASFLKGLYAPRDTSSRRLDDMFKATSLHHCMTCFQPSRPVFACVFNPPFICKIKCRLSCCRVTPQDGDTSPSGADEPTGATGGAGAMAISASSTLSLPMSQGKPSLRRIKGRIHRSKSLDSIDLLESSVRPSFDLATQA